MNEKEVMKCPRCDSELDEGHVVIARDSAWNESKPGFRKFAGLTTNYRCWIVGCSFISIVAL